MHLDLDDLFIAVGVVIAVVLFVLFVVPVLLLIGELLLVAILLVLGVLVRVAFRRPWIVDAVRDRTGERYSWKVVGWRRSAEVIEMVSQQLASGRTPNPGV